MTAPPRDTSQIDGVIFGLPMALLALLVLLVAAPAIVPSWNSISAETRLDPSGARDHKPPADLDLAAYSEVLRKSGQPANLARAAQIQLVRAQLQGTSSIRGQQLVVAARRDLQAALKTTPADRHAWMRLAVAHYLLQERQPAARALLMSLRAGRNDALLLSMQFDLAVILWNEMTPEARQVIGRRLAAADDLKQEHAARVLRERLNASPGPDRR